MVLRADLLQDSQEESAADDRENQHPRGEVQRRLAVKQRAVPRLHFYRDVSRRLISALLTGTSNSLRRRRYVFFNYY